MTNEKRILLRAAQLQRPVNGTLELLPLCNMNCDMCYIRRDRSEVESGGGLRTAEEWIGLGEEMKKAGVLFLLLTGGEPLLFPDFQRLYLELKRMGMVLTINTNGTLLDEKWADFSGEKSRGGLISRFMERMRGLMRSSVITREVSREQCGESGF